MKYSCLVYKKIKKMWFNVFFKTLMVARGGDGKMGILLLLEFFMHKKSFMNVFLYTYITKRV